MAVGKDERKDRVLEPVIGDDSEAHPPHWVGRRHAAERVVGDGLVDVDGSQPIRRLTRHLPHLLLNTFRRMPTANAEG